MNALEKMLAEIVQQAKYRRYVMMVADALVFRLSIPAGRQLVMILGDGTAEDNREAVRQWVEAELPKLEEVDAMHVQAELAMRLYKKLQDAARGGMVY